MSKSSTPTTITKADLEAKLRAFQGDVQGKVDDQKSTLMMAGGAAAALVILIFFLLGRRSGKKKTTFVEIRRI